MKRLVKICICTTVALLAPASLMAADQQKVELGWSGKGEFGFVASGGNTHTRSLKLALEFIYNSEKWRHRLSAGALNTQDSGAKKANRYDLGVQSDYKFSARSYAFGALRYERDDFSAFRRQSTASFGYGRQFLDNEKHKLKAEAGAGYRTATRATTGKKEKSVVFRGVLDWSWKLASSTSLGDKYLIEAGSNNTYMQNDLGLSVAINAHLAMKLAFQVRRNSNVPPGVHTTDTLTSANLVYNF